MSGSKKLLFVAAALALFGVVMNLGLGSKQAQAGGGAPVMVLNTPLPVAQGTSWNVSVANTPGVNIANTPSVNVANSPAVSLAPGAQVRDADNAAREPIVRLGANDGLCDSTDSGCQVILYTVPQGKRLVLEYASMDACIPAGQAVFMAIRVLPPGCDTSCSGPVYFSNLSPAAVATDADSFCAGDGGITSVGQTFRIYANAGEVIKGQALRNKGNAGSAGYQFSLAGYLVDVP